MNIRAIMITATLAFVIPFTGCAVTRQQESVGQYVDDATITTRVKASFAKDPTVAATSISVETLRGTVQLSGFAKNSEERMRAEELARRVAGVTDVKNAILVR